MLLLELFLSAMFFNCKLRLVLSTEVKQQEMKKLYLGNTKRSAIGIL